MSQLLKKLPNDDMIELLSGDPCADHTHPLENSSYGRKIGLNTAYHRKNTLFEADSINSYSSYSRTVTEHDLKAIEFFSKGNTTRINIA